jgi:UDP-2,3-diacylglucosamine pyrophosphatase LpxH
VGQETDQHAHPPGKSQLKTRHGVSTVDGNTREITATDCALTPENAAPTVFTMLVVISDLHLNDGSAAPANISAKAFAIWMEDVLALARQNKARELVFLYLGDMVDLLRTEHWFYPKPGEPLGGREPECFPLEDRPWGDRDINRHPEQLSQACRARALAILRKIFQETSQQLACLRGDAERWKGPLDALGIPIRRLYVPGNHDRLFWVDPVIRQEILQAFAATAVPGPRPFEALLPEYGLLARHGHEWDPWNYEAFAKDRRPEDLKADDYGLTPIGDVLTTELLARLSYQVAAGLPSAVPEHIRSHVYDQLRCVEDVRPLSQALHWVLVEPATLAASYDAATQAALLSTLNREAKSIIASVMSIPFVKAWVADHDEWNLHLDEADILQDIRRLSKLLDIKRLDLVTRWAERLGAIKDEDDGKPAVHEIGDPPRARFCVYGHSHTFRHVPMGRNSSREELVYFNAGTWRPRVAQAKDQKSFASYQEMTYLVFYRTDEDLGTRSSKGLSYELWSGIMKK